MKGKIYLMMYSKKNYKEGERGTDREKEIPVVVWRMKERSRGPERPRDEEAKDLP